MKKDFSIYVFTTDDENTLIGIDVSKVQTCDLTIIYNSKTRKYKSYQKKSSSIEKSKFTRTLDIAITELIKHMETL